MPPLKSYAYALVLTALLLTGRAFGASLPVVYNNLAGDGGQELDRAIKKAYSKTYTITDTRIADGYVEPVPTEGTLPKEAKDDKGVQLAGYVLAAYIVSDAGAVMDPVILRSSDPRLSKVALDAMAEWHFKPGQYRGRAVATTAAQEFTFGPRVAPGGFTMTRLVVYQDTATLVRRMPGKAAGDAYIDRLMEVAHNFFVADLVPETLHIIIIVRPSGRTRVWFLSSIRPGDAPELRPLRTLLEAVKPFPVKEGPVAMTLSGNIMGGDGNELPPDKSPIPSDWSDLERTLKVPLPVGSDPFLELAWPEPGPVRPQGPLPLTTAPTAKNVILPCSKPASSVCPT